MRLLSLLFFYLQNVLHLTNQPKRFNCCHNSTCHRTTVGNTRTYCYSHSGTSANTDTCSRCKGIYKRKLWIYVDYKELARNPDPYKGKALHIAVKSFQVIEGDTETQHRIAVNGDYDNVIYVAYPKNIVTSRILDDDYVTVYGTSLDFILINRLWAEKSQFLHCILIE